MRYLTCCLALATVRCPQEEDGELQTAAEVLRMDEEKEAAEFEALKDEVTHQ